LSDGCQEDRHSVAYDCAAFIKAISMYIPIRYVIEVW
jgi:hypothetical protein